MSFTFENQGTNTYLVYELRHSDEIDSMSLGMLTNNTIPGLAAASFTQMDTTKYIKYNVSAKVSVAQLFSGTVNKKRLVGVFAGVVDAMLSAEEYMIDTSSILLDLDYIFADVSTCETVVVCLPVMNAEHKNPELSMFFKNIIFNTQFDQTENCDHVAQILNYLNSSSVLVLADFKELLEKIGKEQKPAMVAQPKPVETAPVQPAVHVAAPQQPVAPNYPPVNTAPPQQPVSRARHENLQFGANYTSTGRLQNPPKPAKAEPPKPAPAPAAAPEEPGMSMFYLLQHYNKENAAIYKAQQEAKKNKKNAAAAAAPQPVKQKPGAKQPNVVFADPRKPAPAPGGYAVPGKQPPAAPGGFAVPGKQPPAAPGGFAVPGKQPPAAPGGFAVPGKQPPAAPGGFAVPGRQTVPGGFTVPSKPAAAPGQMQGGMPPVQKPAQPANAAPQNAAPRQAAAPAYQRPAPAYQQPAPTYQQPAPAYQQPQGNAINFGETTVLSAGIGETTVLGGATEVNHTEPHLIRTKNNEKIPLNKPVFRIGKERSYVDYFISDNTAISRSHANIINHNGEFFVVDTNSTNHTYVNGGMISSNVETRLSHGTKIRLANEDFEFRMY